MVLSDTEGLTKGSEQKVVVMCDTCEKKSTTTYANYNRAQEKRGDSGVTQCRSCACKDTAHKRRGHVAHNKGKRLPDSQTGENHPSWKGGRYISADGYVMVRFKSREKGWAGYRKEHSLIMESHIGRELLNGELVHHIDGNKQNNAIDNLHLCSGHSDHREAHISLMAIGYAGVRSGRIKFDKNTGSYVAHVK